MTRLSALVVTAAMTLAAATFLAPSTVEPSAPGATNVHGSRAVVRSGDPAPVTARVPAQLFRAGFMVDGGIVFADLRTAVYSTDAGVTTVLAYIGQRYTGGTIAWIRDAVPAPDGSAVALAGSAAGGSALLRLPPGGGAPELLLASGQELGAAGDSATVGHIYSHAIDAMGRVVVNVALGELPLGSALVRVPPGGAPEVLLRDGDPLGGAVVRRLLLSYPAVNASGTIAFAAELTSDVQVIATISHGAAPVVLEAFSLDPEIPGGPLNYAGPSINDAGDLAFLWTLASIQPPVVGGTIQTRVQRIRDGVSSTIAAPGSPAPGGDAFSYIVGMPPVIDAQGRVLFSAQRTDPIGGLYRFDHAAEVIAETGDDAGNGAAILWPDAGAGPALRSDGTILFGAWDTMGYALFSRSGTVIHEEIRAGDPIAGPARFAGFQFPAGVGGIGPGPGPPPPIVSGPFPYLGAGPILSPGGRMIFDATVTGHARGLFVREPDGVLATVAMDGDASPGGGAYDGYFFSHHSVNDAGMVAFLARDEGAPYRSFIAYGPMAGPLTRVVGTFDQVPDSTEVVYGFPPPSRLNAAGSLAIPLYLDDGTVVLYGWDGSQLLRVAGPGDLVQGDGEILSIRTGEPPRLHPPLLDDAGNVVFEAITALGGRALYRAPLRAGGAAGAVRLAGEGDPVEGGILTSFSPLAYDLEASGRLAFQTSPPGASESPVEAVTYLAESGAAARRVVGSGDEVQGVGPVEAVVPHVAMGGGGRLVHEVAGPWLLASTAAPAGFETAILAGPGHPSPDGGAYLSWPYLLPTPPPRPAPPLRARPAAEPVATDLGTTASVPDRLGSDGGNLVAWQARTTTGPEAIVLFDFSPNDAPFAAAGPGQVVECAGPAGAVVTLDAFGSFDPNGDVLDYEWSGPFATTSGPRPAVTVPLGTWTITLMVRDAHGAAASATVDVTVRDTLPPSPVAMATPAVIWPPDGRMTPILVSLATRDICDPAPAVVLTGITATERKGSEPATDIAGAAIGTDDRAFQVRARRAGGRDGRTYTATYLVTDRSGNSAPAIATVRVVADRRR